MPDERLTQKRFETIVGRILQAGVAAAASVMIAGGICYLATRAFAPVPDYHAFNAGAAYSRNLAGILANARSLNSYGIIQLGLLLLIATPLARVVFSVIAFAIQKDILYVAVTLAVLAVCLFSLVGF